MAINFRLPAIPFQDKLTEANFVATIWNKWLQALVDRVQRSLWYVGTVSLTSQTASISATAIGPLLPAGLYRVEYHMRVTQAATTSSSVTFTLNWTDGAVAQTYSWAALAGNTTASAQSAATLIHADQASQVTYETAYTSTGATPMSYRLDTILFRVGEL